LTALHPTEALAVPTLTVPPEPGASAEGGVPAASPTVLLAGAFTSEAGSALREAGYSVVEPRTSEDPLDTFSRIRPDVVVAAADAGEDGFGLLGRLREGRPGRAVPVILITSGDESEVLTGLRLGADDCVARSVSGVELAARVAAKTARPPVPAAILSRDLRTGLLSERTIVDEAGRELDRGLRTAREGGLGIIEIQEMPRLHDRFGGGAATQIATQVTELLGSSPLELERIGLDHSGRLIVLLPETTPAELDDHLRTLAHSIAAHRFTLGNEDGVRVTPVTGWARFGDAGDGDELLARATTAMRAAANHLDLLPLRWTPALEAEVASAGKNGWVSRTLERFRLPAQFVLTLVLGIGLPFVAYMLLGELGMDVSGVAYWVVMVALLVTAATIWLEGFFALDPQRPPDEPGAPYPAATAIIAAYLPNEAATIRSTIEAFQRLDYPGPLQILVAYNTPEPMAVEDDLREMARQDPRILPLKVANSTSKAQNVNAAMSHVTGEFVGMFDADHQPEPRAFRRAWRWLSNGYDVVQGHCVIRNGDASLVARTVAVEFESIYAVSHPGRAALHGFGLFGGSNGYWRTSLLAQTRMHGNMLTEDIDSTLRVLASGARIASDPALISYELAPTNARALWKQRARWAQGWFQVSRKHLSLTLRSPHLGARQKGGLAFLLGWREIYPWLSMQMFPVLAYTAYREGGITQLNWLAPALGLATLFTLAVGPAQTLFAWRLAVPELRERKSWFWTYLLVSSVIYTEWKNVIARIAQIKELFGEAQWNVTPRTDEPATALSNPIRPEVDA
jgi:cellulose synthase/poly-beta-1,6-N-acetylglucosamine synthase-like glycosyltransferase/GGDEF domain-containing protein